MATPDLNLLVTLDVPDALTDVLLRGSHCTVSANTSRVCLEASRAALTSAISPGSGMPRLSMPMTSPTTR